MTKNPKYGKFEKVFGRGLTYILNKPIRFTQEEYRNLKFNKNVGIESCTLLLDPPIYVIRGICLKSKYRGQYV